MKTITEMEYTVLMSIANQMYAERGFSDVDVKDIAADTKIGVRVLRGVISSLIKKDLIYVDDDFTLKNGNHILYLTPITEGLFPQWLEEGAFQPVDLIIKKSNTMKKAKKETPVAPTKEEISKKAKAQAAAKKVRNAKAASKKAADKKLAAAKKAEAEAKKNPAPKAVPAKKKATSKRQSFVSIAEDLVAKKAKPGEFYKVFAELYKAKNGMDYKKPNNKAFIQKRADIYRHIAETNLSK